MKEIDNRSAFGQWLSGSPQDHPAAVQSVDVRTFSDKMLQSSFPGSIFLCCEMEINVAGRIVQTGGVVIPAMDGFEFDVHRPSLYSPAELFKGFELADAKGYEQTYDFSVYRQYCSQGKSPKHINTSLARRLHDHSITDALEEAIEGRKVVAVMGGHSMERGDPYYERVASLSQKLTLKKFLMISGGGPGAMEATHLGAYFATRSEAELSAAIEMLKTRPDGAVPGHEYEDPDWLHRAWQVADAFPLDQSDHDAAMSIGIPTWLYGHEPPTLFATHLAKYFANSVREDGLLAIANHGVIFAPGSAGTTQEIFQDAAQNHYATQEVITPMILLGERYWTETRPVWPLLVRVSKGHPYGELIALTDSEDEIMRRIAMFDPEIYTRKDKQRFSD